MSFDLSRCKIRDKEKIWESHNRYPVEIPQSRLPVRLPAKKPLLFFQSVLSRLLQGQSYG